MILLLDIGNSRVKWAVADRQKLGEFGVFDVSDLVGDSKNEILEQHFGKLANIDKVWISNVGAQSALEQLSDFLKARFAQAISVVKVTNAAAEISNNYRDLNALGVDRWVAAIGARAVVPDKDLIVIDVGTAVTIDWLSIDNSYEGGVILPGSALMHSALLDGTAHIEATQVKAQDLIGKTTQQCVNAGVGFGLVGAIEGIVHRMQNAIARPTTVLISGGGAAAILDELNFELIHEPQLMLIGLLDIAINQQKH